MISPSTRPKPAPIATDPTPRPMASSGSCRICGGRDFERSMPDPERPERILSACLDCGAWHRELEDGRLRLQVDAPRDGDPS